MVVLRWGRSTVTCVRACSLALTLPLPLPLPLGIVLTLGRLAVLRLPLLTRLLTRLLARPERSGRRGCSARGGVLGLLWLLAGPVAGHGRLAVLPLSLLLGRCAVLGLLPVLLLLLRGRLSILLLLLLGLAVLLLGRLAVGRLVLLGRRSAVGALRGGRGAVAGSG